MPSETAANISVGKTSTELALQAAHQSIDELALRAGIQRRSIRKSEPYQRRLGTRHVSLNMDAQLHLRVKLLAVNKNKTLTDLIMEGLSMVLHKYE